MINDTQKNKIQHEVINVFNTNLISLYYDQINPAFSQKLNLVTLLIILKEIDLGQLNKFIVGLQKINKSIKNIAFTPKIFTFDELKNSLDVFPIEFLELKENSVLLNGEDTLKQLIVNNKNLRTECEFYLRSHLLKLREAYLSPKRNLTSLIKTSFPSFIVLFKYILSLVNTNKFDNNQEIIKALSDSINFKVALFLEILLNINKSNLDNYFPFYIEEIQNIIQQVDQLNV
ncbi:MAG: hypothetical protein WC860_03905 [Candidatus Margulisiibacteriota bacterium]|jgi:hypothetical protein